MVNENEIKAIFSLLQTEPAHKDKLTKSLTELYRQEPQKIYTLAEQYFGTVPPFLKQLFRESQNNLQAQIDRYLNLKNPSLPEALLLIAQIINPDSKKEEVLELLNLAREDFDKVMDSSFEISQKAQILQIFFFETLGFKTVESPLKTAFLNLPEIFKNMQTTPLILAVLYLIFIYPYEVKADILKAENKIIVRLRDVFSLEPVYVDIAGKGFFVDEAECDMYAAGNMIKWDSHNIIPLTNLAVFKLLLADLTALSKDYSFLSVYLD